MIKITYDTDTRYQSGMGETFYCKSLTSAKRLLKEEIKKSLENEDFTVEDSKQIIKEFNLFVYRKKLDPMAQNQIQINTNEEDFHIMIESIELY